MILSFNKFINEGERYQNILKGYGKDYDNLVSQKGVMASKDKGYFKELPSNELAEDLLEEYYKPGFKLLDIGCGIGNILKLGNEIGYQSTGIEVNEKMKKYHNGLDVIYGDALEIDFRFINKFDVIYLYRPIEKLDKCDDLFKKIYDNCKDSCIIIYVLPSQLELNLKRKFEYKMFPIMSYKSEQIPGGKITDIKKTLVDTGRKTEYNYDEKYKEYYSIMKPKRGVKDINVISILERCNRELLKYKAPVIDKFYDKMKYVCNEDQFKDFFGCLNKVVNIISKNELKIKFKWKVEPKRVYNESKFTFDFNNPYYLSGESKSIDILNDLKNKISERPGYIKKITLNICYIEVKGRIYEYFNPYGSGYF